jgi:hypothetical protein
MKVPCEIDEIDITKEDGSIVKGVMATCSRCNHTTESYGTNEKSIKRCLVMLREECPEDEENFYTDEM